MIRSFHVTKRYGAITALRDITLQIDEGEFVFLTGQSGAGKTTLLRLLYRAELPTSGQLIVSGRNLATMSRRQVPRFRRRLGLVFQDFKLIEDRTVFDNAALVGRVVGLSYTESQRRANELLRLVGVDGRAQLYPAQISGGEQQARRHCPGVDDGAAAVACRRADGKPRSGPGDRDHAHLPGDQSTRHDRARGDARSRPDRRDAVSHLDPRGRPATHAYRRPQGVVMMRVDRYLRLCFGEAMRGLIGHRRTVVPAILIIAVSLVVLGGFMLVSDNLNQLLMRWRERGHVQLFLQPGATAADRQTITETLRDNRAVESFRYLSADDAADQFREDFEELGDLLAFLESNPLPASFVITVVSESRHEEALVGLTGVWHALPGVDAAQYDLQVIRRLEFGVAGLRFIGVLLGGAVLIGAIITTTNVIRVLVVARRREIVVLRLIGATESVVRGRFLAEGAIQGFLGSLVALVALYGIYKLGVAFVAAGGGVLALVPLRFFDPVLFLAIVGSGVAAGLLGALLAFGAATALER